MARPIKKRATKASYLGSGAGSLKSGTGATAKKPRKTGGYIKTKFPKSGPHKIEWPKKEVKPYAPRTIKKLVPVAFKAGSPLKAAAEAFGFKTSRPPKSPATGLGSVFGSSFTEAKKRRKTTRTMRRRAKR